MNKKLKSKRINSKFMYKYKNSISLQIKFRFTTAKSHSKDHKFMFSDEKEKWGKNELNLIYSAFIEVLDRGNILYLIWRTLSLFL